MVSNRLKSWSNLDRLNPIIIKEMRQGNRSKAFTLNFLLTHMAMIFFVIVSLSNANMNSVADIAVMNSGFWTILGFFLLFGVPLSGINAINHERAEARLDLLHLTRLTSSGIVRGKWLALTSQVFLITVSILPYVVIRYFMGSVNVVTDLLVIGILLLASVFMIGLSVSLSSLKSIVIRLLIIGFIFFFLMTFFASYSVRNLAFGRTFDWFPLLLTVGSQMVFFLLLAMEFSAMSISPPAENHQTRIRIIYLVQLAVFPIFLFSVENEVVVGLFVLLAMSGFFVLWSALVQRPIAVPSIYRPFVRLGVFGKCLGKCLLYPGYPSGIFFAVLCVGSVFGYTFFLSENLREEQLTLMLTLVLPSILGSFFVPLAWALMMPDDRFSSLNLKFICINFIMLALATTSLAISHGFGPLLSYILLPIPVCNLFIIFNKEFMELNTVVYVIGSIMSTSLAGWYLIRRSIEWRLVERELEQTAADLLVKSRNEGEVT